MSHHAPLTHTPRPHARSKSSRSSLRSMNARDSTPMYSSPLAMGELSPLTMRSSRGSSHRRASSSAAAMTAPSSPFPSWEDPAESVVAPLPSDSIDWVNPRPHLVTKESRGKLRSTQRRSSRATGSLDLSKSVAENKNMGVYTSFEDSGSYSPSYAPSNTRMYSHQRSVSATSPLSASFASPAPFVHPMRQTPGSFTPPILARSIHTSRRNSEDGENEVQFAAATAPQTFSPISSKPPSAHRRPSITVHTRSPSCSNSSSQNNLKLVRSATNSSQCGEEGVSDQDTPPTARSSFDSMFGRRYANPEVESKYREAVQQAQRECEEADVRATIQQLRREYAEKQRRKDAKIAAKEAKAQAKRERKELRQAARERKGSVTSVFTVSDEDEEASSDHREVIFPSFADPDGPAHQTTTQPAASHLHASSEEREYTPSPLPEQPPVKRTFKAASNKWGRFKFDATTFWIHSMRSVGLRPRN